MYVIPGHDRGAVDRKKSDRRATALVMIGERPRIPPAQDRGACRSSPTYILCSPILHDRGAGPRIRCKQAKLAETCRGVRSPIMKTCRLPDLEQVVCAVAPQVGKLQQVSVACKSQVLGRQVSASSVSKFSKTAQKSLRAPKLAETWRSKFCRDLPKLAETCRNLSLAQLADTTRRNLATQNLRLASNRNLLKLKHTTCAVRRAEVPASAETC